ncbi:protein of unknown function (plasmid) [Methylocella tundrae]|uniref:Uncharacterized protein n=1 Tax=Methylocella tundrae TaxID=227605 RepID=A0A4U8Z7V4_METTU|nr:hypothetical protein [Methylocella tundrae]VFU17669.1 protein of unknown function [Methylocella tundrae]
MLRLRGTPTGIPYPTTPALRFQQAGDSEIGLIPWDGVDYAFSAGGGEAQTSSLNARRSNLNGDLSKPITIRRNLCQATLMCCDSYCVDLQESHCVSLQNP